ncbi:MAG TPA: DUF4230 domain-containing protein [Tetrasphaera sp.]|uniref:DUF4230 domain-containing protein n=1 Tax=Nostocoides sp. TaxID=1917966 RepID=UPI002BB77779|nr:DUF4230 domain-containing protein [Tetrasphaera sp.]HNQ07351.1 DUF4230 domain-containing protein [Tetrasphaera sp.]
MPSASARERAWVPLAVVAAAVLAMAILFAGPLATLRDALFGESTPKPGDTTLLEIRKTAELRAATGSYSVPVYFGMDEHGVNKVIPDIFDANSGVAIYQGSIDALIDLRGLTDSDIKADKAAGTLTLTVPPPTLTTPNIDESRSKVVAQNRGIGTRVNDFFAGTPLEQRQALDQAAVQALQQAAAESGLEQTARDNGRDFLTALGHNLGYPTVTVVYRDEPAAR